MKFLKIGEIKCKCDVLHLQKCCLQVHQFNSHTAELCRQQAQNTLRYGKQVLNSLPKHQSGHSLLPSMISMIRASFTSSWSILHRYVMSVWRDKAMLQREFRLMEQEAQNHYQHFLQYKVKQLPQTIFILSSAKTLLIFFFVKVFTAWREETASAVSVCCQQREALARFQMFQNKGTADLIST